MHASSDTRRRRRGETPQRLQQALPQLLADWAAARVAARAFLKAIGPLAGELQQGKVILVLLKANG